MKKQIIPPITDHLPLEIRAFAERQIEKAYDARTKPKRKASTIAASPWGLTFDTETHTDPGQRCVCGGICLVQHWR